MNTAFKSFAFTFFLFSILLALYNIIGWFTFVVTPAFVIVWFLTYVTMTARKIDKDWSKDNAKDKK